MTSAPPTRTAWTGPAALLRQWAGLLGAPLIWFIQFEASYSLVPHVCRSTSLIPLHLLSAAALAGTIIMLLFAWQTRQSARELPRGEQTGGPVGRSWLMGITGILVSGFFCLLILAQWIPAIIIDPCQR
jgi:hypothetical protein